MSSNNLSNFVNNSKSYIRAELPISPRAEHLKYNQKLYGVSLFPYVNSSNKETISSIIVSFRFRSIEFSKKRALPFFLALELLTQRKCVATVSQRNVQVWKLRKGRLVGCKVTLRREGIYSFIDSLSISLPRREKFQPTRNIKLIELYSSFIKKLVTPPLQIQNNKVFSKQINRNPIKYSKIQPNYALTLGELILFYPIEVGLGLHPDVQRVQFQCIFASLTVEEQFYFRRFSKIPVLI